MYAIRISCGLFFQTVDEGAEFLGCNLGRDLDGIWVSFELFQKILEMDVELRRRCIGPV